MGQYFFLHLPHFLGNVISAGATSTKVILAQTKGFHLYLPAVSDGAHQIHQHFAEKGKILAGMWPGIGEVHGGRVATNPPAAGWTRQQRHKCWIGNVCAVLTTDIGTEVNFSVQCYLIPVLGLCLSRTYAHISPHTIWLVSIEREVQHEPLGHSYCYSARISRVLSAGSRDEVTSSGDILKQTITWLRS